MKLTKTRDSVNKLQQTQGTEEHVKLYHLDYSQQNPDCGKLYRINDQVSSINKLHKNRKRSWL